MMVKSESSKKSIWITLLIIVGVILVIGVIAFICSNYVSKEFIYQETKECNKLKGTVNVFESKFDKIMGSSPTVKEIFYSPKWNECVAVSNNHMIKGVSSERTENYSKKYRCEIYMNGEKIKEYDIPYNSDENCDDKFEKLFTKRIENLKRRY